MWDLPPDLVLPSESELSLLCCHGHFSVDLHFSFGGGLCFEVPPIATKPKEMKTKENITEMCLFRTANKSANEFPNRRNRGQTFNMVCIVTLVTFDP